MHLLTNKSACSISVILQNAVAQLSPLKYQILFGLMRNYHCPSLTTKQENKSVVDKNTGFFFGTDFPSSWAAKVSLEQEKKCTQCSKPGDEEKYQTRQILELIKISMLDTPEHGNYICLIRQGTKESSCIIFRYANCNQIYLKN